MSNPLSVLQRATRADVTSDPFPHIVLHDALPADLYAELAASFPKPDMLDVDSSKNNLRWDYDARHVRKNLAIPRLWRDFIAYQASQAFFDEIVDLFYDDIHRLYPEHYPTYEGMKAMRAGLRERNDFASHDVLMDAMLSGNTPVTQASSVRSSHIDNGDKLFSGLFYMRPDNYDAIGGDLTISRFKPAYGTIEEKAALFSDAYIDDSHLDHVRTVTYDRNLLVLFINSIESVHGVTVRQPSDKSRLFINLVGEVDPPLYVKGQNRPPRYVGPDYVSKRSQGDGWLKSLKRRITG